MNDADPGLFGPRSVTWQMHGDPMMWIAGIRALYLQALHPRAVRGVTQNSDFRRDAWGRLLRTASFVGTITYGTTAAAEQAGARVRKIHRTLKATDPATGETYGIDEPELLLWVHCAEVDSYLQVQRRSGFPLTDAQADRYVDEHRAGARLVGLDPAKVPATAAALAAYFERVRPELALGPEAADVDDFLRNPPVHPCSARRAPRLAARGSTRLPVTAPVRPRVVRQTRPPPATVDRRLRATGAVLRAIPDRLRWQLPPGHILKAMARLGPGSRPPRTGSAGRPPYWTGRGGRSGSSGDDGAGSGRWRTPG
ncbi:oxygenase MpaB family protein [Streptomyces microflavus]